LTDKTKINAAYKIADFTMDNGQSNDKLINVDLVYWSVNMVESCLHISMLQIYWRLTIYGASQI